MCLKLMYITNNVDVALIAEKYGVDRIWVDLEWMGKEERQHNMDTVKSKHTVDDIRKITPHLSKAEMLVRINPMYQGTEKEVNDVIEAGADIIMLPMWKTKKEVEGFLNIVNRRKKTTLLLETKEAVDCIDEVLELDGIDEIHIGLNDLSISYGYGFMFEPLSNGIVDVLCDKFRSAGIPYGFGGIAKVGSGTLPAEKIVLEHYRLGSSRVILSRSFCNIQTAMNLEEIEKVFRENIRELRDFEKTKCINAESKVFEQNKIEVKNCIKLIKDSIANKE